MYWENCGEACTRPTLQLAVDKARELQAPLVIASNTGSTVFTAWELGTDDLDLVCVTHMVGFSNPGEDEMSRQVREQLQEGGVQVLTTTHVLAGVDRALRFQFQGIYPPEIIANSLRMLGQGTKVCVEICIMALDAGLIPYGGKVVAVGGSGRGADTAVVITPAHSTAIFDIQIHEILAKPANW